MSYDGFSNRSEKYEFFQIIILLVIVIVLTSFLISSNVRGLALNGLSKAGASVSNVFSQAFKSINIAKSKAEVAVGDIKDFSNQTKDEIKSKYKFAYKFDTTKVSSVEVGVEIDDDDAIVKSRNDFVYFPSRFQIASYDLERFDGESIQFFCKNPEVKQKHKFYTCQNKKNALTISDAFNPNVAVECSYYGLDKNVNKFTATYKMPLSQDGFTRIRVVNDPENIKNKGSDLREYLIDEHPDFDFDVDVAENAAGPLDIKLDIDSFTTFNKNILSLNEEFSSYLELNSPLIISIQNNPLSISGGERSFSSKVSYVDMFRTAKLILPNYVFLGCKDDKIRFAQEGNYNTYHFDMDAYLKSTKGKLKDNMWEKKCDVYFDQNTFTQNNFESVVSFGMLFEVEYDYILNYDRRVNIVYDYNKTDLKNRDFVSDILISLGYAGPDNLDIKLDSDQQQFKKYALEKFKDKLVIDPYCSDSNDFNDLSEELITLKSGDDYKTWLVKNTVPKNITKPTPEKTNNEIIIANQNTNDGRDGTVIDSSGNEVNLPDIEFTI